MTDPSTPGPPDRAVHRFLGDTNRQYFEGAIERAVDLGKVTDQELLALLFPTNRKELVQPEFQRRQIDASNRLRHSIDAARASADTAAIWLIALTIILVVMTGVLVWLTLVLVTNE